MSELRACNDAWQVWRGDIPPLLDTPPMEDGSAAQYASKMIFDAGWQAAMQYVEEKQKKNQTNNENTNG